MNKFVLMASVAMMTFCLAGESQAEKICNCGKVNPTDCCWEVKNGTLTISGSGEMNDYETNEGTGGWHSINTPWVDDSFNNVIIEEGITRIGKASFTGFNIDSVLIPDSVTSIGTAAFLQNNISSLALPNSIQRIEHWAFESNNLSNVVLPDSIKTLGTGVFQRNNLASLTIPDYIESMGERILGYDEAQFKTTDIICKGSRETCSHIENYLNNYAFPDYINNNGVWTTTSLSINDYAGIYDCNGMYFWDGSTCKREPDITKRKCCDSCKDMGGWCNRVRYTPAEAAEVLHDDNTNEVTITFRK